MKISRLSVPLLFVTVVSCLQHDRVTPNRNIHPESNLFTSAATDPAGMQINEALLLTRFTSFEALQRVVQIQYSRGEGDDTMTKGRKSWVKLTHQSAGRKVVSLLESGISQADFTRASNGNMWDKMEVAMRCPFAVMHRNELMAIENLGRRRPWLFGKGDVAFYDLAEAMVHHMAAVDTIDMPARDLSEKGYLNTFNHITAQAFMTSVFSEDLADFVADVHERFNMPELIAGNFTEAQLSDLENGPVDNYIDIINNEWGQELGKVLGKKYLITHKTVWTPALLTSYLNDIQSYHSWALQIGFVPFRPTDDIVVRFSVKINKLTPDSAIN